MSEPDSRLAAGWFSRAEKDLVTARHLLGEKETGFIMPAAMLLQQAVEKYLKGYLLANGWKLRRTHDLSELLDQALKTAPELARFDAACIKMTEYYTEQRYPPLAETDLSKGEVRESLSEAEELISEIKRRIAPSGQ